MNTTKLSNASGTNLVLPWCTHRRIVGDSDDDEQAKAGEDQELASVHSMKPPVRQNRGTAGFYLKHHNFATEKAKKPASPNLLKEERKPCRFSPSTAAAKFFSKQVSSPVASGEPPEQSKSNSNTSKMCPQVEPPASDLDRWIDHTVVYRGLVSGQDTVHNGQPGVWRCVPGVDSIRREWIFTPKELQPAKNTEVPHKKPRSKHKKNFLTLPGELRNVVYGYVIPECRMLIIQNKPNKELDKHRKIWSEQASKHERPRSRLSHLLDSRQIDQGLGITMNLLLVCKQIRDDVELYLYSRTAFCFTSANVLSKFLSTASKPGIKAIRRVEIFHNGYANPQLTSYQSYRGRYYDRWSKTCSQLGEEMIGLQHLKLEAHLREWPCDLTAQSLANSWWKACLKMAPQRLPKVEVTLHHSMIHRNKTVLKELARSLEDEMMTLEGRNERDMAETLQVLNDLEAKKAAKEARAKARLNRQGAALELTISKEDLQAPMSVPSKGCKRGLDKYFWVNTAEMSPGEMQCFREQYCSQRHKA